MLDRIILNKNKNLAVFIYTDRMPFTVSTDSGDLVDLIIFFTSPFKCLYDIVNRLKIEEEITQNSTDEVT